MLSFGGSVEFLPKLEAHIFILLLKIHEQLALRLYRCWDILLSLSNTRYLLLSMDRIKNVWSFAPILTIHLHTSIVHSLDIGTYFHLS
jgi:hypothetical protein